LKHQLHVISHTHWDREWYLTFQQFRIKLVDLIDHLLDILDNNPNFHFFNMDGQTIVLEDYLAIKPYNEEKLRKYISEGRLTVGPWYQLNDENLVSGESTVRSLLIGHEIANKFGAVAKIGYLPDQFGNISQMPQIFNGFDIDSSIVGRGYVIDRETEKTEFSWTSPDGSAVTTTLMAYWYNNAQRFPDNKKEAINFTLDLFNKHKAISDTKHLLLMNGVDHLEAQGNVGDIIEAINPKLEECELVHDTMEKYMDSLKEYIKENNIKLKEVTGELRHEMDLAGTLSSRMYIKQANNECEQLLEKYAEPLNTFSLITGSEYYYDFIKYAWKYLMQNHPHDSICGCSVDQVHKEMDVRFDEVKQVAEEVTKRALTNITSKIKTIGESIVVFNTLSWDRTETIKASIDIQLNDKARGANETIDPERDILAFVIKDVFGDEVPFVVKEHKVIIKEILSPVELPLSALFRHYEIEFIAEDVPAFGYKTYTIEKAKRFFHKKVKETSLTKMAYANNSISNGYVTVEIKDSVVRIKNETTNYKIKNANLIEDSADIGDEYRFVNPLNNEVFTNVNSLDSFSIIDNSPTSASIICRYNMKVPKCFDYENNKRSNELVNCPITTTYTITPDSDRVDIKTEIENNATDHRFRALFPTEIITDAAFAEMPFDITKRPLRCPIDWTIPSEAQPQKTWVNINDGKIGVSIINKGLPEYEICNDETNTIALTLLRSINKISGNGDTSNVIITPEAYCLGKHTFEYAVYTYDGKLMESETIKEAHSFNAPMIYCQANNKKGTLEPINNFVAISDELIVMSALKRAEKDNSVILRLYNPYSEDINNVYIKLFGSKSAEIVNLNEDLVSKIKLANETVQIDFPKKKIITIKFYMK